MWPAPTPDCLNSGGSVIINDRHGWMRELPKLKNVCVCVARWTVIKDVKRSGKTNISKGLRNPHLFSEHRLNVRVGNKRIINYTLFLLLPRRIWIYRHAINIYSFILYILISFFSFCAIHFLIKFSFTFGGVYVVSVTGEQLSSSCYLFGNFFHFFCWFAAFVNWPESFCLYFYN